MAQCAKCLPSQLEALGSDSQHPCKEPGTAAHTCNSSTGHGVGAGTEQGEPRIYWLDSFAKSLSTMVNKRPWLKQ